MIKGKAAVIFAALFILCSLIAGCETAGLVELGNTEPAGTLPAATEGQSPTEKPAVTGETSAQPATAAPTQPPAPVVPTPAPSRESPVSVTLEPLIETHAAYRVNGVVPAFTVTGSDTLLAFLHTNVRQSVLNIVSRFADWAADNPPQGTAGAHDLSFSIEITRNDGRFLSMYGIASAYMGGASDNSFGFSFTVDILNERMPSLADLLGEGYEPLLNVLIRENLIAHYGFPPDAPWLLDLGEGTGFAEGAQPHFYLTPDCLGFIYDKYAIYPGAAGAPQAEVALADQPRPLGGGAVEWSYALCTAFDPATGEITLDYVQVLTGEDAVAALMEDERITRQQAEERIYDHDPNEYVRNRNDRLRTFTMDDDTHIRTVFDADWNVAAPEGTERSLSDFGALYRTNPEVVAAGESILYLVTVRGSRVIALE
jgi:hypothetical protein